MALEDLRARIALMTAEHRDTGIRHLSRTIHVVVSPSLASLETWCGAQASPAFPGAERLRPWLNAGHGVRSVTAMSALVTDSMTVDLSTAAAQAGYSILDRANQVIVIADLRDDGVAASLKSAVDSFDAACAAAGLGARELFKIGVFVGGVGSEAMNADTLQSLDPILQGSLDRVFVAEKRNQSNVVINDEDLLTLLGQLIVHLQERPASREHIAGTPQYSDWLQSNSANSGRITGFSATTLFLPIERIVETVVRDLAGAELQEALLGAPDMAHAAGAVDDVLNTCHMQSLDDLCGHLHAEAERAMAGIAGSASDLRMIPRQYDSEMFGSLREDIVFLCSQETVLDGYISARYAAMQPVLDELQGRLDGSLEAKVNELFSSTQGCVPAAVAAVESVHAKLEESLPSDPPEPGASDLPRALDELADAWNNGPDGLALSMRTAIAMVALAAAAIGIEGLKVPIRGSLLLVAVLVGAGTFAYWNGWRSSIKSKIAHCWTLLQEQKLAAESSSSRVAIAARRMGFVTIAEECRLRLRDLQGRITQLMGRYGRELRPQDPNASALWRPLEPAPTEVDAFRRGVIYNPATVRAEMLSLDHPLENWRDAFGDDADPINEHEWKLYERAAIRLLGHADDLAATSLGSLLPEGSARLDETIAGLSAIYRPFVQLRPGSSTGQLRARFTLPGPGAHGGVATIPDRMRSLFDEVHAGHGGAYSLTVMTFLEDVLFGDLRVRQGGSG